MSADYSRLPRRAYTEHLPPGFIEEWAKQLRSEKLLTRAEVTDLPDELWLKLLDQLASNDRSLIYPKMPVRSSAVPPDRACFLLDLLLAKPDRETILADLEEEFTTYFLPKYGARRARLWFWKQTVKSIVYRNAVCRWVLVSGLARFAEWILGQISG
jgi:hypothetical protein